MFCSKSTDNVGTQFGTFPSRSNTTELGTSSQSYHVCRVEVFHDASMVQSEI